MAASILPALAEAFKAHHPVIAFFKAPPEELAYYTRPQRMVCWFTDLIVCTGIMGADRSSQYPI